MSGHTSVLHKTGRLFAANYKKILLYAGLLLLGIILLYPVIYGFLGSISTTQEFMAAIVLPIPKTHTWQNLVDNYKLVFLNAAIIRSLIITLLRILWGILVTAAVSVLMGYIFAKIKFPFKRTLFMILMSSMMIPAPAMLIPNYIWFTHFPLMGGNNIIGQGGRGFLDNPWSMVLTGWVGVGNIFLLRQSFATMGNEMKEAAQIDGAGFLRIVYRIHMPLVKPVLAVMFLGCFVGVWNEYLGNIIYMANAQQWWTIGNVFVQLISQFTSTAGTSIPNYPAAFAISFVSMVPPIIVYIFVQEQFAQGLAMGSIKG